MQQDRPLAKTLKHYFFIFYFFHFDIGILFWAVWHISKLVFLVQNDYIKKNSVTLISSVLSNIQGS